MTWGPIERDKTWAANFVPRVKEILGGALIREGTENEDLTEATDLKIVTLGEAAVAYGQANERKDAHRIPDAFASGAARGATGTAPGKTVFRVGAKKVASLRSEATCLVVMVVVRDPFFFPLLTTQQPQERVYRGLAILTSSGTNGLCSRL